MKHHYSVLLSCAHGVVLTAGGKQAYLGGAQSPKTPGLQFQEAHQGSQF